MKEKVTCFSIFKNSFDNLDQPANLRAKLQYNHDIVLIITSIILPF